MEASLDLVDSKQGMSFPIQPGSSVVQENEGSVLRNRLKSPMCSGVVTVSALLLQEIRLEPVEEEVLESKTVSLNWLFKISLGCIGCAEVTTQYRTGLTVERSWKGSHADEKHSTVVIETAALLAECPAPPCVSVFICNYFSSQCWNQKGRLEILLLYFILYYDQKISLLYIPASTEVF